MATGACGINCDVCKLNLRGVCSTCGPGDSEEAAAKMAAQVRILGSPCPILDCARSKGIAHCMADCKAFPCDIFTAGPYPFSAPFLEMQQRRRQENPAVYAADGSHLEVAEAYWQAAAARSQLDICNTAFFEAVKPACYQFRFLNEDLRIDLAAQCLLRPRESGVWVPERDPLLTLATVVYLKNVRQVYPLGRDIVSANDLKEGHFFQGPHLFRTDPLLHRFGEDPDGFRRACLTLAGQPVDMADAAFRLLPFPRVPLYLLLWQGDEEFKPRLQVLFDRSIEEVLPADAIWALVNRVVTAL